MDKIDGFSLDLEKQNINKIKELFPEAVEEGKINFEMLRAMLGDEVDDSREKYQFTWNGKAKSIKLAQTPSSATLRPCKEKSKDWDTTENLYIEGDNLEVLKQLQKTYYGKIKMIYIDPPYNTGNDFVYNDSFSNSIENYKEQTNQVSSSNPESNGRFHTDWLNMMYSRLTLAKNLLSEDGVIFLSIDDNEEANLQKICNDVFGELNFVGKLAVQVNPRGRNLDLYIAKTYEPILIYVKSYGNSSAINQIEKDEKMLAEYNREDEVGKYRLIGLRNRNQSFNPITRPSLYYPLYVNPLTNLVSTKEDANYSIEIYPNASEKIATCWTWSKQKVEKENNLLLAEKGVNGWRIYRKDYLNSGNSATTLAKSLQLDNEFNNDWGKKRIKQLFDANVMSFPKSPILMKRLLELGSDKNSIIFDFFSGSATLADAVMSLNAIDNGNRKFIMVQLPELCEEKSEAYKAGYKNICEIGEERIRRAGEQIKSEWEKEHPSDGLFSSDEKFNVDIGFKVFKLDSSNVNEWDSSLKLNEKELALRLGEVFKDDRSKEDILYEIMLKYGVFDKPVEEIDVNGKTMYRVGKRYMIVCLDNQITSDDVKAIGELSPKTVIFKESGFSNDNDKINATYNLHKCGVEDIKCI
mgnify:CR=1 FL=1|jgi:adenine-specific DNA-methyltransferase